MKANHNFAGTKMSENAIVESGIAENLSSCRLYLFQDSSDSKKFYYYY